MDRRERERDAAVDLSFSQILEVRSSSFKRRPPPVRSRFAQPPVQSLKGGMLDSVHEEADDVFSPMSSSVSPRSALAAAGGVVGPQSRSSAGSFAEDEDWATGDDGAVGQDMYRFVQPRRLSSWVQDDAVNACFKCHTLFTLLVRKHHCRCVPGALS